MQKNSTVTRVTGNGTWEGKFGLMYKFEIEMDNGDIGENLSKTFNQSGSNERYGNIKDIYNMLDNIIIDQTGDLAKVYHDSKKKWKESVLPFYDPEKSVWAKLFSNKDPYSGQIPTYDLLIHAIKSPNPQADANNFKMLIKDLSNSGDFDIITKKPIDSITTVSPL